MIRAAILAALILPLAACGSPPPRPSVAGIEGRKLVDAATAAWADCLDTTAKRLATPDTQAASAADDAFKICAPKRAALVAEVRRFHRLGAPKETEQYNLAVGESSVAGIEVDLRNSTEITAVSWKLDHDKAN